MILTGPPTRPPTSCENPCKGAQKILSPRLQLLKPPADAARIWRTRAILALIGALAPQADRDLTGAARRATPSPPTDRPRRAGETAHAQHRSTATVPSHNNQRHRARDSIENPDHHRQISQVESGVTKEHRRAARSFAWADSTAHGDPNRPYAYRTFSWRGRDVLAVVLTSTRRLGSSASRGALKTPYTRRAESSSGYPSVATRRLQVQS